jgi:hypothetical protein
VGRTVTALEAGGMLEPVDEARIAGLRAAAAAVDAARADPGESRFVVRAVLAEYRAWVELVTGPSTTTGGPDDELARLYAALSAPMGDAPEP